MVEWWNGGMAEWRNGQMAKWPNGGMAEWRNGGMAEWQSSIMNGTKYYGIKIWKVHRCLLGKAPLGLYYNAILISNYLSVFSNLEFQNLSVKITTTLSLPHLQIEGALFSASNHAINSVFDPIPQFTG
jgi:hypothetical protein